MTMSPSMPLLNVRNLCVHIGARKILNAITIDLKPGEMVGLIGPNGAGKTTLLRALAGLVEPTHGQVLLNNVPHNVHDRRARARIIGYLPQDRTLHWPLSVRRLVELGRLPHLETWQTPAAADNEAVARALRDADVAALADRSVAGLSGGETARVAIARVLAGEPSIVLADEPMAGLDPGHKLEILDLFHRLSRVGRIVVVVLHDLTLAARYCDRLIMLSAGHVDADGAPVDVLSPQRIAEVFEIDAKILRDNGSLMILPWASTRARAVDPTAP
jgi:iron complex transport system ATP-binding protein